MSAAKSLLHSMPDARAPTRDLHCACSLVRCTLYPTALAAELLDSPTLQSAQPLAAGEGARMDLGVQVGAQRTEGPPAAGPGGGGGSAGACW